jgi:hypothetical protein
MWIVSREAEKEPTGMKKKSKEAQRKFRALSQKCNILLFSFEEKFFLYPHNNNNWQTLHFQNGTRHLRSVAIFLPEILPAKKKKIPRVQSQDPFYDSFVNGRNTLP